MGKVAPHRLVTTLEERWAEIETDFHRAYWDSQTDADPATDRRRVELELELRRVKGDRASLESVRAALEDPIHDPVLRRQLEVLRLSLSGNQMSDDQRAGIVELAGAVESEFASYRPEVDGRSMSDNDLEEILKSSDDDDLRRRAWAASKEIGAVVSERVRELARIRNQVARDLGFADHYRMALDLQEIDEDWLFDMLGRLESLTEQPYGAWKADLDACLCKRFGTSELRPWHYADPFFQSLPPDGRISLDKVLGDADAVRLAQTTFDLWGIDLSRVMETSDLYPRERKCQHAFCLDVDRSGHDVRILANVVPGERWVEVMLHESGHAAYDVAIDPQLPYLLHRAAHTFVTEAVAILSGRLVRDPEWMESVAQVPGSEVEDISSGLRTATTAQALLFARWGLVMVHFERDLYADPEADLDARWWELVERFQLVRAPDRAAPDWAAKIHLAVAPVYYHNYLLGELFASQLRATCVAECGGLVGVREAGRLLTELVCRPGALLRWDAVVESSTGRALTPDDFAASLE